MLFTVRSPTLRAWRRGTVLVRIGAFISKAPRTLSFRPTSLRETINDLPIINKLLDPSDGHPVELISQ